MWERAPAPSPIGDFNGDGKLDLAVANRGNDVSILLGNGDGTFESAVNYVADQGTTSLAVGDFDGDGTPDLAITNSAGNDVSVLLGNGDGTVQPPVNYSVGQTPRFGSSC
jgi:FG-GAP-like repeat